MHSVTRFFITCFFCLLAASHAISQSCDCAAEFAFTRAYIEKNYPGYKDKTPDYKELNYAEFTAGYEAKAATENSTTYCMMFIKEWLKYFKDEHLQLVNAPLVGNDTAILAERIRVKEVLEVTPDMIKAAKQSKGIEGVYYREDSSYKIVVVRTPNTWRTYAAVVLESKNKNWTPGMVKFDLKEKTDSVKHEKTWTSHYPAIYYMENHGVYSNKIMSFTGGYSMDGGIWKKEGLKESAEEQAKRNKRKNERKNNPQKNWNYVEFSKPTDNSTYLRISNFDGKITEEIDSFVASNDSIISNTQYMVLDLRGNGGGSDRSYLSLLPYLYTNPIITLGVGAMATRDNINADKAIIASVDQEDIKKWLQNEIMLMEENYGRFTPISTDTYRMDSVKRYPEKIAILVDGQCAGTTEQFLLAAQQSTKVTIMGQTTNGTLDYSNKRQKKLSCIPYILEYPITRSGRLPAHPIDNIGIVPQVPLPADADWTKAATQYLNTGKIK